VLATHTAASTPFVLASALLVVPIGLALLIRTHVRNRGLAGSPTPMPARERAGPNPVGGSE
jgi:hypothetical protein